MSWLPWWFSGIYIAPYFDTSMVSTIAVEVRRIRHKKRTEKMEEHGYIGRKKYHMSFFTMASEIWML